MKKLLQAGVIVGLLASSAFAQTAFVPVKSPSLCTPDEQVLWSCQTKKNKRASLCASKPVTSTQGYIQYRYGTATKTDMVFPATTAQGSQQQFRYARYTRPLVTMLGVWFTNAGYGYELRYDMHDDEKFTSETQEIVITAPDKKETHIACNGEGLINLENLVPEEKDLIP